MLFTASTLLLSACAAVAAPAPAAGETNVLARIKRAQPHEVEQLFKRQSNYPPIGAIVERNNVPQAWLDRLSTLSLPNIPVATGAETRQPQYAGRSPTDPEICSFTYECDNPEDLKAPAAGKLAFTFDDGPSGGSEALENYMQEANARADATHFMIGGYIAGNPTRFQSIASNGGHVASHTWSHHYMTTLTNEQVVGELGWSMQIMSDLNNGRIPLYWRPPYGDVDNRVRAIAKGVFGLETVTWSHDTGDWNLDQGGSATVQSVTDMFASWLGDRSQGLNVLEHEVRPSQIDVFRNIYPRAKQAGWDVGNVAHAFGRPWYQNSASGNSSVTIMAIGAGPTRSGSASASASASVSASASASASGSASASSASSASAASSPNSSSAASSATASPSSSAGQNSRPSPSSAALPGAAPSGLLAALMAVAGWILL